MRYLWGLLLLALLPHLILATPALANHFPDEFEYLNGTELIKTLTCQDIRSGEQMPCQVYHDAETRVFYAVVRRAGRILLVFRKAVGRQPELIYPRGRLAAPGE